MQLELFPQWAGNIIVVILARGHAPLVGKLRLLSLTELDNQRKTNLRKVKKPSEGAATLNLSKVSLLWARVSGHQGRR